MNLTERSQLLQQRANDFAIQSDHLHGEIESLQARLNALKLQLRDIDKGKQQLIGALSILREQIEQPEQTQQAEQKEVKAE